MISSNLERLIYQIAGCDDKKNAELMQALKSEGVYEITDAMKAGLKDFAAGYATEAQTAETIHDVYKKTGYVMDTHTAVAAHVCQEYQENSGDKTKCVVASTASPYKFAGSVMAAIDEKYASVDEFDLLKELSQVSNTEMPNAIKEILNANILHTLECDVDKMEDTVKAILEL